MGGHSARQSLQVIDLEYRDVDTTIDNSHGAVLWTGLPDCHALQRASKEELVSKQRHTPTGRGRGLRQPPKLPARLRFYFDTLSPEKGLLDAAQKGDQEKVFDLMD